MNLAKFQFYVTLLKLIKEEEVTKEEVREWLKIQIDELDEDYNPMELLEFIQVNTRKFAELVTNEVLLMKKEVRTPKEVRKFYSAPEIYNQLNRKKSAFSTWKKNGWFPNAEKGPKSWVIPNKDLQDFLDKHERLKEIWNNNQ